jgi:alpha-beta hydrolase superfamily lysophospholipase
MQFAIRSTAITVVAVVCAAALALTFGGPTTPSPMKSITEPFKAVDYSDLPALSHYTARDDAKLAFRYYGAKESTPKGSVVLLHGSGASSRSMHPLAKAFASAGYAAYTLDVRGHGDDADVRGDIAYIGQLEDDLEDFIKAVKPTTPTTLVGFSSGGGFALRVAGSKRQRLFSNYLLLSPFISQDAPTYRSDSGGWVDVGVPRLVTIMLLNRMGITAFNHLTVMRFAVDDEDKKFLTPTYSYNLARNYRPKPDYLATIRAADQPMRVIAGRGDEVFHTDHFKDVFQTAGRDVPVELIPGVDHIGLTLDRKAIEAEIKAVEELDNGSSDTSGT